MSVVRLETFVHIQANVDQADIIRYTAPPPPSRDRIRYSNYTTYRLRGIPIILSLFEWEGKKHFVF